jgi:hypothetical protein
MWCCGIQAAAAAPRAPLQNMPASFIMEPIVASFTDHHTQGTLP